MTEFKVDSIKLSDQSKDQLVRLKRLTGIEHWNVLCRWAFCLSLAEEIHPPKIRIPADSFIEMNWKTFAGEHSSVYEALLIDRTIKEYGDTKNGNLLKCLRAHVTRGISYLTARSEVKDIAGLLGIVESE